MAFLSLALLLTSGCGDSPDPVDPPISSCGPVTCAGCCADGVCMAGNSFRACGLDGVACATCEGEEECLRGVCTPPQAQPDAGADGGTDGGVDDAGTPDAGPQDTYILFEPRGARPVVPQINDLYLDPGTGLVTLPVNLEDSPAQQEYTRDYLNTLDGFPTSSAPSVEVSAALDPLTVNDTTVRVLQVQGPMGATHVVGYNADTHRISIIPTSQRGWNRGSRYVVAVLGGLHGVKDLEGKPVIGSQAWRWVRSATPLVDGAGHSTVSGLSDVDAQRLEVLRPHYAPHLATLASQGISRESVAVLWSFTTVGRPEVSFDLTIPVAPYPSNLFLAPGGTGLNLPVPPAQTSPFLNTLYTGLNKLDGFSTTAPIVSENHPTVGTLASGLVAADSLVAGTRFLRLGSAGAEPSVTACLNCTSSLRPDGTPPSSPQELQFVPQRPLEERTTYAAVVTTDLKDTEGRNVVASANWALVRMAAPLVDGQGKSLLAGLPDNLAMLLEPVRLSLKPALDELAAGGLPRSRITLATVFRTQSTRESLVALAAVPGSLPSAPTYVRDLSSFIPQFGVPHDRLGALLEAGMPNTYLLTGADGSFGTPRQEWVEVVLTVPNTAMPEAGWPVVLFSHEMGGSRMHLMYLANELARSGFATVAMDLPLHGERSQCAGSPSPYDNDNACADPGTQRCDVVTGSPTFGRCVARDSGTRQDCTAPGGESLCASIGQGRCLPTDTGSRRCEGGTFRPSPQSNLQPAISGWNMLQSTSPFAVRDNLRQTVADLSQLVRVLRSAELASALGAVELDTTRLHFVGVGLGGMAGSLFLSVSPDIQRGVLNAPGSDPMALLLTSPTMGNARAAYLAMLASQGITSGTPRFDEVIRLHRQVYDPADPQNVARAMKDHGGVPPGRDVFIQYITRDLLIPTTLTERLLAAANTGTQNVCPAYRWDPDPSTLPDAVRHAFLLYRVGDGAVTDAAQRQAASFLATGVVTDPTEAAR